MQKHITVLSVTVTLPEKFDTAVLNNAPDTATRPEGDCDTMVYVNVCMGEFASTVDMVAMVAALASAGVYVVVDKSKSVGATFCSVSVKARVNVPPLPSFAVREKDKVPERGTRETISCEPETLKKEAEVPLMV